MQRITTFGSMEPRTAVNLPAKSVRADRQSEIEPPQLDGLDAPRETFAASKAPPLSVSHEVAEEAAPSRAAAPPHDPLAQAVQEGGGRVALGAAGRGTLLMVDEAAAGDPMRKLYPAAAWKPQKEGPSTNLVGKLTGEASNVAATVNELRANHPELMVYPPERRPGDDRVIMDLRYIVHGEDRENAALLEHLDAQRNKTVQYWYDR